LSLGLFLFLDLGKRGNRYRRSLGHRHFYLFDARRFAGTDLIGVGKNINQIGVVTVF